MGSPNNFKSRHATRQKVLSGGTNRPIVEEAAILGAGPSYNPLDFGRHRFRSQSGPYSRINRIGYIQVLP